MNIFTVTGLLSIGEKKTSEVGLVLAHLYFGKGFPALEWQESVTLARSTGFPCSAHTGMAGGTAKRDQR